MRRLQAVLAGVGAGKSVAAAREIAMHLRRSLAEDEIAMLTPEWLAIPARDEFSEDGQVEMDL